METFLIIIGIIALNAISYIVGYDAACRKILADIDEIIDDTIEEIKNNEKGNIE